jgi:DNA repair protein RecO
MNCHNEEGIILRPVDFRERDRILTFLTPEQGKISGIVHGARSLKSQNRAATESLVLARFEYVERRQTAMVKIEHCEALDLFPAIRKDYSRFLYASYFAELLLLTEIPSTEASLYFNWLASILKTLQHEPADLFRKAHWEWELSLPTRSSASIGLLPGQWSTTTSRFPTLRASILSTGCLPRRNS